MKIAVIGAGSTYTPELVEGFAARSERLGLDELVLHDIDAARLEVVAGLARRILAKSDFPGMVRTTTDINDAVDGAAAVLIQLRVGGQRARLRDETIPGRYGLIGQETTGAGGMAKALRTVPVVLDIADTVRRLAGDDAWIIDFTNPVGIVTRALLDAGHRAMGLCNVAIGFQRRFAAQLGVEVDQVELDHLGLNHLTWIRRVVVDGVDRLPELLMGENGATIVERTGAPLDLIRAIGAIPSYYLHYYYATDEVVADQRTSPSRAEQVLEIEAELLRMYADPALDHKPELLERRGGAYYSEAAAALVTSLLTGDGARHYVDVRNRGAVAGMGDDDVVEIPALVDRSGAHPVDVPPPSPEMLGLMQAVTAYEVLAIQAAVTADRLTAERALVAHPLVRQWSLIEPLLDDILRENAEVLPQWGS
jgi:6-phospho-beta-glucosidase